MQIHFPFAFYAFLRNANAPPTQVAQAAGSAVRQVMQRLGNLCFQLDYSHRQQYVVCVNTPIDNSGFQDVALCDALHHVVYVAGP